VSDVTANVEYFCAFARSTTWLAPQYAQRQPVMFASSCEFGQVSAAWVNAGDLGHTIATVTYVNLDSGHRALTQGDVTWVKREVTYVANLPRVTQISLAAPPRVSRRADTHDKSRGGSGPRSSPSFPRGGLSVKVTRILSNEFR